MPNRSNDPDGGRVATLTRLLESDPNNLNLLADIAEAALAENAPAIAREMLERYTVLAPLPPRELNLAGIAALQLKDFATAETVFGQLLRQNPDNPALRFNRAWALAMLKAFDDALALLDDQTTEALPQAATLQVQLLHERGLIDEAMAQARKHLARHPDHKGLLAAVSVLAIDLEDLPLAAACASRAGDSSEALTTLGTLALGEDRNVEAFELFERALQRDAHAPRAWVGVGLARLLSGEHQQAASDIQHGAEMFGDHIGSWIAAGWAHIFARNVTAGRQCFETALAIDHNFSESHGSLAVVQIMDDQIPEARRSTQTALRLDPRSFSGALAQALLLSNDGKTDTARALIERALHTPIDESGRTIAQSLARYSFAPTSLH